MDQLTTIDEAGRGEFLTIIDKLPLAYNDVTAIWRRGEEEPGNGGLFSIFVSDLCKGWANACRYAVIMTRCA